MYGWVGPHLFIDNEKGSPEIFSKSLYTPQNKYRLIDFKNMFWVNKYILFAVDHFVPQTTFFWNIPFPINWIGHWKVFSHNVRYVLHNEVGGDIIVMKFYSTMVENRKEYFWLFSLE